MSHRSLVALRKAGAHPLVRAAAAALLHAAATRLADPAAAPRSPSACRGGERQLAHPVEG